MKGVIKIFDPKMFMKLWAKAVSNTYEHKFWTKFVNKSHEQKKIEEKFWVKVMNIISNTNFEKVF